MDTYRAQHAAFLEEKIRELVKDRLEEGEKASDSVRAGLEYYFGKKPIGREGNFYTNFMKEKAKEKIGEGKYFNWNMILWCFINFM